MAEEDGERRNFRILLGQGVLGDIGYDLTSEKLVLPFLYTALGAPLIFAGLLVPIARATKLGGELFVAPLIKAAQRNKWFVAAGSAAAAAALALICLSAGNMPTTWLAIIFLLVVAVLGVSDALGSIAIQDMLGRLLPAKHRSRLLFTQSGIAGIAAIAIAFASQNLIDQQSSLDDHIELLWAGIVMTALAGIAIIAIGEPSKRAAAAAADAAAIHDAHRHVLRDVRRNFQAALALPWLRRFMVARTLFLSIELAIPFYAIHAATLHADNANGLSTFVISSSIGMVVGGIVWPYVGKGSIRPILFAATAVAALAGFLALAIELEPALQTSFVYGGVFVLTAFGTQGISNGRRIYLVGAASDEERPFCIAVTNIASGVAAIAIAAGLGTVAHIKGAVWPILILIALNVAAGLYVMNLTDVRHDEAEAGGDGDAAHAFAKGSRSHRA